MTRITTDFWTPNVELKTANVELHIGQLPLKEIQGVMPIHQANEKIPMEIGKIETQSCHTPHSQPSAIQSRGTSQLPGPPEGVKGLNLSMTIADNTLLYSWNLLRDNLSGEILSQCVCISKSSYSIL